MNIKDIISKKADGNALTQDEIKFAVNGYVDGTIPDYQMSALLMAIYTKGMDKVETFYLTDAMLHSGEVLDLSDLGTTVDKHSTGGVSDTTTIVIVPICACLGVKMLKLSGRGLGHTGGTIDKLEAFTGYNVEISLEKAKQLVEKNGGCIAAATSHLVPADKKLYALRDITSTVASLPLISSSIMSKKLASGSSAIVLDVKYGNGAFMPTKELALKLGDLMCEIGKQAGKKMFMYVDDMNQPLGYNIGQTLESYEAIQVLSGKKGKLYDSCVDLATLCVQAGLDIDEKTARQKVIQVIQDGTALEKLKQMVLAQNGSLDLFDGLPMQKTLTVYAPQTGKVVGFNTKRLGSLVGEMGSIRQTLADQIDYNVGLRTFHKIGDSVNKGDVLFEIFAKNLEQAQTFAPKFLECVIVE